MTKQCRPRWAGPRWGVLIALASAGVLSGCYYYPYGYYPWGYPYPQPYAGLPLLPGLSLSSAAGAARDSANPIEPAARGG
jgi:hypothetical protein